MEIKTIAEVYHQINALQTEFALSTVNKVKYLFLEKAQSAVGNRLIDIGCGDGRVLKEVFLENCGLKFSEVIGTDKSVDMVKFANDNYVNDKLNFHVLDIASSNIGDNFGTFDIATSYYVFHWFKDQQQAVNNVQKLLKPGGIFHLHFVVDFSIANFFGSLIKKYKSMEKPLTDAIPLLKQDPNFMENFKSVLEESGFNVELSEILGIDYDFKTAETYIGKFLNSLQIIF